MFSNKRNKWITGLLVFFTIAGFYLTTYAASSMSSAASVNLNVAYKGSIDAVDERDWYKFDVEPNKRYYIVVWADNTFGNNPAGLKDTQLRAYLDKGAGTPVALNNTDAPVEMNLGYGSNIIIEAIPRTITPTKMGQCLAPSTVNFFIEQQDLDPETGTYSFKIFVDDMPKASNGTYDYTAPLTESLIQGAVNPPTSTTPAPEGQAAQEIVLTLSGNNGYAPYTVYPEVSLDGTNITDVCSFSYGESSIGDWEYTTSHTYQEAGTYYITARYEDNGTTLTSSSTAVTIRDYNQDDPDDTVDDNDPHSNYNNSMSTAASANLNVAYKGSIDAVDERDWYKFDVEPNKRYYIVVWADNTFGNNPAGLKDTQLRAYLDKGTGTPVALNNTDAPVEMNLGYGSNIIIEAIPRTVTPTKMGHSLAPSTVSFFIEQQDLDPETGTYSFKIFVDDMPKASDGSYDYNAPLTNSLLPGAVNPPAATTPAPVGEPPRDIQDDPDDISFHLKAIDVEGELVLNGNQGLHLFVWFGGDSFDQRVDQFVIFGYAGSWFALNSIYQWQIMDLEDPELLNILPQLRTAPLEAGQREIVFAMLDYMLPPGEIDFLFCIDTEPDGKFTAEKSQCRSLRIVH